MRILFLVYHGFSEHSGISKKIHYQVKGLRENGHDVRLCYYGFAENGHRCRYIDGTILKDYGTGRLAALRQRIYYGCIYNYCIRENIELIYARSFMNASPSKPSASGTDARKSWTTRSFTAESSVPSISETASAQSAPARSFSTA